MCPTENHLLFAGVCTCEILTAWAKACADSGPAKDIYLILLLYSSPIRFTRSLIRFIKSLNGNIYLVRRLPVLPSMRTQETEIL